MYKKNPIGLRFLKLFLAVYREFIFFEKQVEKNKKNLFQILKPKKDL